jgi:hypothetical protein
MPMASDMVTALAATTAAGETLFGAGARRPAGEPQAWRHEAARCHSPGQNLRISRLELPEARQTFALLGASDGGGWGLRFGLNEKGLAVGAATIALRLKPDEAGLTGPELVRLALERAANACQAVEVIGDFVSRHGQCPEQPTDGAGNAFQIADAGEAFVLETCGSHWVMQQATPIRVVSGVCHVRQDWDRIAHGLADLAIRRGWWPENGSKLDFAAAFGSQGPNHAEDLHRWGRATLLLEQNRGLIDVPLLRRALAGHGPSGSGDAEMTGSTLVAHLSAAPGRLPLAWCAFGPTGAGLAFPLTPLAEFPRVFADDNGNGSPLWRQLDRWQTIGRKDAGLRKAVQNGLAQLQKRFDQNAQEFMAESVDLANRGQCEGLPRLASSFMQHNLEHFEEFAATLDGPPDKKEATATIKVPKDELAEIPGGYF